MIMIWCKFMNNENNEEYYVAISVLEYAFLRDQSFML